MIYLCGSFSFFVPLRASRRREATELPILFKATIRRRSLRKQITLA
jgi:hypothetical protein